VNLKARLVSLWPRLVSLWLRLSIVWSIFWLGSGAFDVYLRSCHLGECIFDMEDIRPIVILGPTLAAFPWVVTGVVVLVLWFVR